MYVSTLEGLTTGDTNVLNSLSVAPRFGFEVDHGALHSVTRGLVGDTSFAILPQITKEQTFALTFFFQAVSFSSLFVSLSFSTLTIPRCA